MNKNNKIDNIQNGDLFCITKKIIWITFRPINKYNNGKQNNHKEILKTAKILIN